jgi:hypothetical protein
VEVKYTGRRSEEWVKGCGGVIYSVMMVYEEW